MKILVLNAGSSSIKASLFLLERLSSQETEASVWSACVDFRSTTEATLSVTCAGRQERRELSSSSMERAFNTIFEALCSKSLGALESVSALDCVGHRIVHGGSKYCASTLVDKAVLADLRSYVELAPAHELANIEGVEAASRCFSKVPQVAVFDTAFHHGMPAVSTVYAGPYEWFTDKGIRRFGFHGISHAYCAERVAALLGRELADLRIISCHLGGGGSLAAIKGGAALATTMGFTPLEGLMMKTRSGSIDPGLILHLLQNKDYTVDELREVLNNDSGCKGISGTSGDMREILDEIKKGSQRCQLAFDMYIQSLTSSICSLLPILGAVDAISFAGGVGENCSAVRQSAAEKLHCIGVEIDPTRNARNGQDREIGSSASASRVLVIHTREELAIARECLRLRQSGQV